MLEEKLRQGFEEEYKDVSFEATRRTLWLIRREYRTRFYGLNSEYPRRISDASPAEKEHICKIAHNLLEGITNVGRDDYLQETRTS